MIGFLDMTLYTIVPLRDFVVETDDIDIDVLDECGERCCVQFGKS
jgi:hypothetical protein